MVKKFLLILLTLILLVSCVGCHQDPPPATPNVLVVYFSATGTTRRVAEEVARVLNCDIFEIQPEQPYTEEDLDYTNSQSRTYIEQHDDSARPETANAVQDIQKYDTIFLGYPLWFGQAPKIISTFLESYDLTDKKIIPFCTSASSPAGSSADLQPLAPDANWQECRRFGANDVDEVEQWLEECLTEDFEMYITVNEVKLTVKMEDNSSAQALKSLLEKGDITVDMKDYAGFEKVGFLPQSLPRNDSQINTQAGDIILYNGNQFVIYYGTNSWSLTRLGKIQNVTPAQLRQLLGEGNVTATLSLH